MIKVIDEKFIFKFHSEVSELLINHVSVGRKKIGEVCPPSSTFFENGIEKITICNPKIKNTIYNGCPALEISHIYFLNNEENKETNKEKS